MPEALQTNCAKCTEKQKTITLRSIKRLRKEYPKIWAKLKEQWDPEDKYVTLFETTYGDRMKETTFETPIEIGNRFAETDSNKLGATPTKTTQKTTVKLKPVNLNSVSSTNIKSVQNAQRFDVPVKTVSSVNNVATSTLSPTKTTKKVNVTSTTSISLFPLSTEKATVTKKISPSQITTKTPFVSTKTATTIKPIITTQLNLINLPVPNIEASIQATVSLGTNIVGGIIKGIGALGTMVAETGVNIAEAVVKNLSNPP